MDFDIFAREYDAQLHAHLQKYGQKTSYYIEYKISLMKQCATNKNPVAILDFGCGVGRSLPFLCRYFPGSEIWGCDTSRDSLRIAKGGNPQCSFFSAEERPSQRFTLVFASCVFHHIPLVKRDAVMQTVASWMEPGAELFVFEHNPYNPVTRHLVNTCPFDRDVVLLPLSAMTRLMLRSALSVTTTKYTLFFPASLNRWQSFERFLSWLPLGGQYMVHAARII